jgi:hypothetical protein
VEEKKLSLELFVERIKAIVQDDLREDGRCKHGMLPGTCSYCAGIKMTPYGASVGAAYIR